MSVFISMKKSKEEKDYDKIFWNAGISSKYSGHYNERQLAMGTAVEMEHTTDKDVAEKIARDHIAEIDDYYDRLASMEEQAKKEGHFRNI